MIHRYIYIYIYIYTHVYNTDNNDNNNNNNDNNNNNNNNNNNSCDWVHLEVHRSDRDVDLAGASMGRPLFVGIHQRRVQSEGGAVDGGSII